MATGKVVRKVEDRGFGFIRDDNTGVEYFFHYSAIQRDAGFDFASLRTGTEVEFEIGEGPKGPRAENVTRA